MPLLTSTAYFPPLAWFVEASIQGSWQWEALETYQKGGWRNRCRVLTANGPHLLSVPLRGGKHQQMPIQEVLIDYRTDWPRQHAQTIRSAYGRSPYFEHYGPEILEVVQQQEDTLWQFNLNIIQNLVDLLDLPIQLTPTDTFRGGAAGAELVKILPSPPPYPQVFTERFGFVGGLSVLDGLFCLGPELARWGTTRTFTPWQT